jgi:hypothetical protein
MSRGLDISFSLPTPVSGKVTEGISTPVALSGMMEAVTEGAETPTVT